MAATTGISTRVNRGLRLAAGPRMRAISAVGLVLAAGMAFSLFNDPLASSAAGGVLVAHVASAVPTDDPQSPIWNQAAEATIPLSSQQIYQPGGGSTREVRVRALED